MRGLTADEESPAAVMQPTVVKGMGVVRGVAVTKTVVVGGVVVRGVVVRGVVVKAVMRMEVVTESVIMGCAMVSKKVTSPGSRCGGKGNL